MTLHLDIFGWGSSRTIRGLCQTLYHLSHGLLVGSVCLILFSFVKHKVHQKKAIVGTPIWAAHSYQKEVCIWSYAGWKQSCLWPERPFHVLVFRGHFYNCIWHKGQIWPDREWGKLVYQRSSSSAQIKLHITIANLTRCSTWNTQYQPFVINNSFTRYLSEVYLGSFCSFFYFHKLLIPETITNI